MKTNRIWLTGFCALLAGGMTLALAETSSPPASPSSSVKDIPAKDFAPGSAGTADVVSLAKSGVSETVVLSYVRNSQVAYQPSAQEIVQMKDQGVSQDVIKAMLDRGGELRASGAPTSATQPATSQSYSYVASAAQPATTVVYAQPSPSVVYVEPSYSYPVYPVFVGGYWGPRYYYGPRFYGGYRGGFRSGGFVAVRGGGGGFRGHHR